MRCFVVFIATFLLGFVQASSLLDEVSTLCDIHSTFGLWAVSPCTWDKPCNQSLEGVTCGSVGSVVGLALDSTMCNYTTCVVASIPSSIANLQNLIALTWVNFGLIEQIPDLFSSFVSLKYLDLSDNNLTGVIPSSFITLSALQRLTLSSNSLSGTLPPLFVNLTSLLELDLSSNQFSGQLPEFGTNILSLSLNDNQFYGTLPSSIIQSSSLTLLQLSNNNFSGSVDFSLLSSIKNLNLKNNSFSGDIYSLSGLQINVINLCRNLFAGTIPTLSSSLNNLDLSYNQITGVLPTFLTTVQVLDLSNNKLSGTIPTFTDSLQSLSISNNFLTGTVPKAMENISLISCDLSANCFSNSTWCNSAISRADGSCDCLSQGNCFINTSCLSENVYSSNPCEVCYPTSSPVSWSAPDNCVDGNLVDNPGFEILRSSNNWAWYNLWTEEPNNGTASRNSTTVHSGQAALSIQFEGEKQWAICSKSLVYVEPGDLVSFQGWVRIYEASSTTCLQLVTSGPNGTLVDFAFGQKCISGPTESWSLLERTVMIPDGVKSCYLEVAGVGGPSDILIDDVGLYRNGTMRTSFTLHNDILSATFDCATLTFTVTDLRNVEFPCL